MFPYSFLTYSDLHMKRATVVSFVMGFILLAGCGKTEQQKALESDLRTKISTGHEVSMGRIAGMDALLASITAETHLQDSLAGSSLPAGQSLSKTNLDAAQKAIEAARDSMDDWMAEYTPVREEIKHDEAMRMMQHQLSSLQSVDALMISSMEKARSVLVAHRKSLDSLVATAHTLKAK